MQTTLGYAEGSIGVLAVSTADGSRVGSLLLAGRDARKLTPTTYESAFEPIALPPGDYEVALWQQPCSGICASNEEIVEANDPPGAQLDLCTTRITLTAGETRTITAAWAPGRGCTSFR